MAIPNAEGPGPYLLLVSYLSCQQESGRLGLGAAFERCRSAESGRPK